MADEFEDQESQPRFNPAYAKYDALTVTQLGAAMEECRKKLDAAKAAKTELEKEYDFLVTVKLPPAMEDAGLQNFRLESGRGIRVQDEAFVSMVQGNLEEMKRWLQERGDEAIIKETINSSTLKSYIMGRIKDHKDIPANLVKVNIVPKARFF